MRSGLRAQVFLFRFELAHLAHDAFAQAGVRGETLVEVRDLLAQVFLLELEQRFGVALLDAGDEQREKSFDQIPKSAEHAPSAKGAPTAPALVLQRAQSVAKIARRSSESA